MKIRRLFAALTIVAAAAVGLITAEIDSLTSPTDTTWGAPATTDDTTWGNPPGLIGLDVQIQGDTTWG